jgi:hypothetical protein
VPISTAGVARILISRHAADGVDACRDRADEAHCRDTSSLRGASEVKCATTCSVMRSQQRSRTATMVSTPHSAHELPETLGQTSLTKIKSQHQCKGVSEYWIDVLEFPDSYLELQC